MWHPFNSHGSSCLKAKYDVDEEGLKVLMEILGAVVAESNKRLMEYCALVYHIIISYAPT